MKSNDIKVVNGDLLRQMIIAGSNHLFNHYPKIDALNVFPVPDGDTGTNMNLTMTSGSKEVMNIRNAKIGEVARIFSRGLLMGARGNSGVILSQIFRGFAQGLEGKDEVDVFDFAEAWANGAKVAYKAVMKPVEGTILTVIRESSEALRQNIENINSINKAMDYLLEQANISLKHTPELLPVLKEVGVVDSGGAGLVKVLEGMIMGLKGKVVERKQISNPEDQQETIAGAGLDNEEFGYCTEFILRLIDSEEKKKFNEKRFTNVLASLGNSLVVVRDEDIVKVHVHTLKPGMALNFAQGYGEFVKLKIENMQEQHSELAAAGQAPDQVKPKEKKEYAIIATSVGEGLKELFENLQVDYIVSGGQTMNPSTEDFVEAIKAVNAKNIFILPNNKNIVMASEQACIVAEDLGSNCKVIPSKSIPQGLVACMNFNSDASFEENENEMRDAITRVKTGQVTFAIKDTKIDEVNIRKDEFMGISEGKIICCEKDPVESAKKLLDKMIDDDSAIVTLLYGEATSKEEAEELAAYIEDKYTIEVELHFGGQPVYNYIFGVE